MVHQFDTLKGDWDAYNTEGADCEGNYSSVEITATEVKSPALSVSCVVRKVTKFDVCPWGMIFKNRERARALRSFQINPWSPGYHIVLQCTGRSSRSETIGTDWVIEKGSIRVGIPRDYRCPWEGCPMTTRPIHGRQARRVESASEMRAAHGQGLPRPQARLD